MNWDEWHSQATGSNPEVRFIAEIGINHNGDVKIAKDLMVVAASSGCDAVKFQKRDINKVYTQDFLNSPRESRWGTTQRDQKLGLEFGKAEYDEIDRFAQELGISWSASAWDLSSLEFIESYNPQFHKVASAFATNREFLSEVAKLRRLTIVSTGMTTIEDCDEIVSIFKAEKCPLVLLHCVATYPANRDSLNLRVIQTLKNRYSSIPIGYSGHESSVSPSIVAASLGAVLIERHVTLDRSKVGSDQAASLEPAGLRNLVGALKWIPVELGNGKKQYEKGEKETATKLRYWEAE
jgi:N-acetylneuraminate synthase